MSTSTIYIIGAVVLLVIIGLVRKAT